MVAQRGVAHGSHKRPARPSWQWQRDAACRGMPLELFFGHEGERLPEKIRREAWAKAVCDDCPVRKQCEDFAMGDDPERYGFWAGLGEEERKSERRRRQRRGAVTS